jgi:hypothetical protein
MFTAKQGKQTCELVGDALFNLELIMRFWNDSGQDNKFRV